MNGWPVFGHVVNELPSRMNQALDDKLIEAISLYDYPSITWDFLEGRERCFSSMVELDHFLKNLLKSGDVRSLKDGLSGILYWGYYRAGFRDHRVTRFRTTVADVELDSANGVIRVLDGTGLMSLKELALPQFSNMAFITKFRTFLDPERYCVLDSKIAKLAPLAVRLKCQPTYIPINEQNDRAYKCWVDTCFSLASHLQMTLRPVDVERGLFCLVDHGRGDIAEQLLSLGA
jgi:hypothetical protein